MFRQIQSTTTPFSPNPLTPLLSRKLPNEYFITVNSSVLRFALQLDGLSPISSFSVYESAISLSSSVDRPLPAENTDVTFHVALSMFEASDLRRARRVNDTTN